MLALIVAVGGSGGFALPAGELRGARGAAGDRRRLAEGEKQVAQQERARANFQQVRAETARHAIQIDVSLRAWEQHDVVRATVILDGVSGPFQSTWEYHHLRGLCRRKALPLTGHTREV